MVRSPVMDVSAARETVVVGSVWLFSAMVRLATVAHVEPSEARSDALVTVITESEHVQAAVYDVSNVIMMVASMGVACVCENDNKKVTSKEDPLFRTQTTPRRHAGRA